uniref:Uncharacterized protein n=1 Tax=Chromera velia CCMP2878 TaxID=1169474 RepID=A0A0G4H1T1_9ALVE|eukprot:Cvel_5544.t1-p1 / transcript=Cvel_5544.t1 / gene=Cvel_5544 / organism=Chromera_velia_CCMP2878 / gene_product=hypothetical protein / transcript_product=hypothetical protein / location=Cvel_scaffold260:17183-17722(+) / protein_length=141 / sequence_SO=supercontig / SO=protein_coding / is_pseudo=false
MGDPQKQPVLGRELNIGGSNPVHRQEIWNETIKKELNCLRIGANTYQVRAKSLHTVTDKPTLVVPNNILKDAQSQLEKNEVTEKRNLARFALSNATTASAGSDEAEDDDDSTPPGLEKTYQDIYNTTHVPIEKYPAPQTTA